MDGKMGREIKFLLDHYVKTHLRIPGKPKETDLINLDAYINFLVKIYGKNGQSCLVDELIKKSMSAEGKFSKISVFLPTLEESLEAKRRKNKFKGLA